MKIGALTFFSICLFTASLATAQTNQVVDDILVLEHFTNASCGPCAAQNPAMEAIMNANGTKATSLKYHVSWPGVDPMYSFNTVDPMARVNFYTINGVPAVRLSTQPNMAPSQITQSAINDWYNTMSPAFRYNIQSQIVGDSLFISGQVVRFRPINATDLRLHTVLAEHPVNYDNPPGSNGERDFPMVVRKMFPTAGGLEIGNGSVATPFSYAYYLPAVLRRDRLQLVLFVQSAGSKTAYKGVKIAVNASYAASVSEKSPKALNAWPVPSQGLVNLAWDEELQSAEISLFDLLGKEQFSQVLEAEVLLSKNYQLDGSSLPNGVYFLQLQSDKGLFQRKIILN